MRVDRKPVENVPEGKPLANYNFGEIDYEYLGKMTRLCKVNNIALVLIKAPSLYPYWYEQWENQIKDYAEENDLLYINFLEQAQEIGIDYETDTYDGGLHMNLSGAEKITRYLGDALQQNIELEDRRDDQKLAAAWNEKRERYDWDKERQYEELKRR